MARKRMVTRTIDVTYVTVMVVNVEAQSFDEMTYHFNSIPADKLTDADLLKMVAAQCEDGLMPVKVIGQHTESRIYGMPEEDFLLWAQDMGTER